MFIRIFQYTTVATGVPVKYSLKCGSQGGGRCWFCWFGVSPGSAHPDQATHAVYRQVRDDHSCSSATFMESVLQKLLLYLTIPDSFEKRDWDWWNLLNYANFSYLAKTSWTAAKTIATGLAYCFITAAVGVGGGNIGSEYPDKLCQQVLQAIRRLELAWGFPTGGHLHAVMRVKMKNWPFWLWDTNVHSFSTRKINNSRFSSTSI